MNHFPGYFTRRQALSRIGAGFGSLALGALLADENLRASAPQPHSSNPMAPKSPHYAPKVQRVIFLFMNGGPSQVDTFDPKPMLTKHAGEKPPAALVPRGRAAGNLLASPFSFSQHGESGLPVSEIYPHLAKCVDDLCIIRSMHTNLPNHEPSLLMMNSGETQPTRPSMGSWLMYGLGSENLNLPGYVVLCPGKPVVGPQLWSNSFLPGIFQGVHIDNSKLDPKTIIPYLENTHLSERQHRRQVDLLTKFNKLQTQARDNDSLLEGRIEAMEMAYRMQFDAQEAFDVSRETAASIERYGQGEFAQACLAARRLAERGVRMTQIYYGNGQPWDDHGDIHNHKKHAASSDQAIAALLSDLKDRGMFEDTLVIWGGEFGRTPSSEGSQGRDHNNLGFTMWLAGGGVKRGFAYGATDDLGFGAVENPVHVHDLHATILHLLGFDHTKLTYRYSGRDFRLTDVHGKIVHDVLA